MNETIKAKCQRCKKKIDLEQDAYFRRRVWNDPEDTTKGDFIAYSCLDCTINERGFW